MSNTNKFIDSAILSVEDKEILEKNWYEYQGTLELIKSGIETTMIIDKYQLAYASYNKQWIKILKTYFNEDYTQGNNYEWNCDFITNVVTITL